MTKFDVELPKAHAMAIGYVAAYSSLLEKVIEESIWGLLNIDENAGRAVTSELMLAGNMNLLLAIAQEKIKDDTLIGDLKAIHKRVLKHDAAREDGEALNKRRNRVIHSNWEIGLFDVLMSKAIGQTVRTAINYRAKEKVTLDYKHLTDKEILDIAAAFLSVAGYLDDWTIRAKAFLESQNQQSSDAP